MLTFAVVASTTGRPLDPRLLDLFAARASAEVPFPADERVTWTNDPGTIWFGGWHASARGCHDESPWCVDEKGLTAFAGRVWPRRDGWTGTGPVAAQLGQHLQRHPLVGRADELAGIYVVASMARRGASTLAADPMGAGLLYRARGPDVVVLSTRAAVAAQLLAAATGTAPRRDVLGAGWLAYMGYAMGLRTGFEQVTLVPDGAVVEVDAAGRVDLHRSSRPAWRQGADELAADPRAGLELARTEMATALRMMLREPGTHGCLGLTGGKDSRLVLALLLAEGLASEIEFQTHGDDDLPDVVIARELATRFGLRHVVRPGMGDRWAWQQRMEEAVRDRGLAGCTLREIAFRTTAWVTAGMANVAEPRLGRLPPGGTVLMTGVFGESLRTNYRDSTRIRSKAEVARFPDNHRPGSVGVLDRQAVDRYRAEVHELLFEGATETDSPQDVVDTYYLRQRLRHWLGITLEVNSEARAFPLYSITAMRLAFAIGTESRHAEWIHHNLIRSGCEDLLHVPFTSGDWPPGAGTELLPPARHSDAIPAGPPSPRVRDQTHHLSDWRPRVPPRPEVRTALREYRANQRATDVEIMRLLFRDDPANPAFELIDSKGAQRALDHFGELREGQRMQVYGALTAVVWLGGHELSLARELSAA